MTTSTTKTGEQIREEAIAMYTEGLERARVAMESEDRATAMAAYKAQVVGHKGAEALCKGFETFAQAQDAVARMVAVTDPAWWVRRGGYPIHMNFPAA